MFKSLYEILLDVTKSSMVDDGDLPAAGLLILTAALHGLHINRAGIWIFAEDKHSIYCRILIDGDECVMDESLVLMRSHYPHYFASLDKGQAIIANQASNDASTFEFRDDYLQPFGITSMLDAPIRHRGNMLGIICCEHQGPAREWSNEEVTFVSSLADTYGRALSAAQRNDYELQLKKLNDELQNNINERTDFLQNALRNLNHTQAKLIESEKLASIGRLVSGLAHEINTPLGIAVTSASHCDSELKRVEKLYRTEALSESDFAQFLENLNDGFELINTNLNRAANLVQNFKLSGAIHIANEEEVFDLRACIELTLKSLQPLLKKHQIDCEFIAGSIVNINSYPGAIAQIITNLITNSIHHAFNETSQKKITIHLHQDEKQIVIDYQDSGCGIAADIRGKIFEPFFTTARKTGGSGLGLAIVYNLVTQKLGGEIYVGEASNQGAQFTISIPQNLPILPI